MSTRDDPQAMHTDDKVAPGISRRTANVLVAVGLLGALLGSAGLFVTLLERVDANRHSTNLTRTQVQDIKDLLAERKTQRDSEQAQVQAQLDAQARVLCGVVDDFLAGARGPGQAVLSKAARDMHCDALPKAPASSDPASHATSSPRPTAAAAAVKPKPAPNGTSTTPPSQAGEPPTGIPTPPTPPLGLPLLTPICGVIPPLC